MNKLVSLESRGAIGVVTLDNPPVNALGQAARQGLLDVLATALADPSREALVLIGRGRLFSAGADIGEFGDATRPPPQLGEVIRAFDGSAKPIVAAMQGVALGGALELAMACHYRLSTADLRLGLSEVKFGVIPGAGGTQLLPRLIGSEKALEMITSGEPINARQAATLGLIDLLIEGDLLGGALAFAREIAGRRPLPRAGERAVRPQPDASLFAAAAAALRRRSRGAQAPLLALAAVQAAGELPFEEGLERERELWVRAASSPESAAMRHVFLAEREAANLPDVPKSTPAARIRRVAVIGGGAMGTGITMALVDAGLDVTLVARERDRAADALRTIGASYAATVGKGKLTEDEMRSRLARVEATASWDGLADVDLVIESVDEDMYLKQAVFAKLDALSGPDTILATNTSALDVDEIARATRRPARVVGLHFFSPAQATRVMEIVRGEQTAGAVMATSMKLARDLGKFGVPVRAGEGFVGSRMFREYQREANLLLLEGASPQQVDGALTELGMAMGPFATLDLAGLDVWRLIERSRRPRPPAGRDWGAVPARLADRGRFGQKTNRGFYRYHDGGRAPHLDPEVEAMAIEAAKEMGIRRRSIADTEIVERCLFAVINEGARVLDEGIALRASDVDVIWVDGYGFPRHRGGPMYHADLIGLGMVCGRLRELEREHGEHWRPSPLLARLAREGRGFG